MAPFLLVTKSSPPSGGAQENAGGSGIMRLMPERRSLVQAPGAPRDQSQHPRARNDYDEETAYESYMNPEPGFQSGPGDSANAD